jgi:flavin reductase (DIM6/NTAB) family NADH-FMN oxidoreductase RutF
VTVDPDLYRRVVGHFATGVTVVTAAVSGSQHAMTASSVTSVSLDPVLMLVSVEKIARFHDAVLAAGSFAVNVLAADQEPISRRFATRGRPHHVAELPGVRYHVSELTGALVLDDCLATLECTTWAVYDGGDHSLVVGEVVRLALHRPDAEPLVYYAGRYGRLAPK